MLNDETLYGDIQILALPSHTEKFTDKKREQSETHIVHSFSLICVICESKAILILIKNLFISINIYLIWNFFMVVFVCALLLTYTSLFFSRLSSSSFCCCCYNCYYYYVCVWLLLWCSFDIMVSDAFSFSFFVSSCFFAFTLVDVFIWYYIHPV